jgi:hypothetical protein
LVVVVEVQGEMNTLDETVVPVAVVGLLGVLKQLSSLTIIRGWVR